MASFFKQKRKGFLQPTQLIGIILLLTAIGVFAYYYNQQKQSAPSTPIIQHGRFLIEEALKKETEKYDSLVYGGVPKTAANIKLILLENRAYYVGYSDKRKNPLWAAYKLHHNKFSTKANRPGFKMDPRTFARVDPDSYRRSGYDRGHLAPNSAIVERFGTDAQRETFLMSNIVPQKPELNRKVWLRLERLEEEYANNHEAVWIFTGPIFDEHINSLDSGVEIPDAFFKILIDEKRGSIRALAFLIPQTVTGKEYINQFITSIDEIERLTGLDFLWPLSDEVESALEAISPNKLW